MLYRLEIENFYSVRDRQVIDLTVPRNVRDHRERFAPIFEGCDLRAPKVVSLFGANGSGKSTVLRALAFLVWFLRESFERVGQGIPCAPFNDVISANRPIRIAVEDGGRAAFDEGADQTSGTLRYELELATKAGRVVAVTKEALRRKPRGQGKWMRVFERLGNGKVAGSKAFSLSGYSRVVDMVRPDASVVSTLALFEHRPARSLVAGLASVSTNIAFANPDPPDARVVKYLDANPRALAQLNTALQRLSIGVQQVKVIRSSVGPSLIFRNDGLYEDMPWPAQSHGTQSLVRILPPLLSALSHGGLAVIDALDSSMHPLLLREILGWFYDPQRNPHDAQLWLSCQSASLMAELIKEEVVLCEKDQGGRTRADSLMDLRSVRRGDNLYRKYLGGAFGAVPRFG